MTTPEKISLIIAIISAITAFISINVANKASKYSRNSVITNILIKLRESYSTPEMTKAVHYLMNLKAKNTHEFNKNPYSFARKYLAKISPDSEEWEMRRMVSHFYNHVASLVENKLVNEEEIFAIWGINQIEIIELLEPIETIIGEKYYPRDSLPYDEDWLALRLLEKCKKWNKKRLKRKKYKGSFTLPINTELYLKSQTDINNNSD